VLDETPTANGRNEENTPSDENEWADDDCSDIDDFDDMVCSWHSIFCI
jgi:hypothetical protein